MTKKLKMLTIDDLPKTPGVYFLIIIKTDGTFHTRIGEAKDLKSRCNTHKQSAGFAIAEVIYMKCINHENMEKYYQKVFAEYHEGDSFFNIPGNNLVEIRKLIQSEIAKVKKDNFGRGIVSVGKLDTKSKIINTLEGPKKATKLVEEQYGTCQNSGCNNTLANDRGYLKSSKPSFKYRTNEKGEKIKICMSCHKTSMHQIKQTKISLLDALLKDIQNSKNINIKDHVIDLKNKLENRNTL